MFTFNWKIRLGLFIPLAVILVKFFSKEDAESPLLSNFIVILMSVGIVGIFTMLGVKPEHFPECIARSFTRVVPRPHGVVIKISCISSIALLWPVCMVLLGGFLIGIFDQSFYSYYPGWEIKYQLYGIASFIVLVGLLYASSIGCRCDISDNKVLWTPKRFGINFPTRTFNNVRISEYAMSNGYGGGPVIAIEYDGEKGKRQTTNLTFRNLYHCSREEFGDIVAEFLGEPERRTVVPTKAGYVPRLV